MAKKKPYRFPLYLLARGAAWIFSLLPRTAALYTAKSLGSFSFHVVARQREKALTHLRMVYSKEKTEEEIRGIARQVFENAAMTSAELLQFPKMTAEKAAVIVDSAEAVKIYDGLLAHGKGLISMTAHIGNWELLAGIFGLKGYKGAVLARRIYYEPYNSWVVGLRQAVKVPTLYRDDSSREILKRLAAGEIVGLLPDQDIDSLKGVFVPFLGKQAYTPVAPVRIALSTGAPMLPNFLIRENITRYKLVVGQPIFAESYKDLNRDEAVLKMTENWMSQFEKVIREYPGQWAWMHNRWKTQPKSNSSVVLSS